MIALSSTPEEEDYEDLHLGNQFDTDFMKQKLI